MMLQYAARVCYTNSLAEVSINRPLVGAARMQLAPGDVGLCYHVFTK